MFYFTKKEAESENTVNANHTTFISKGVRFYSEAKYEYMA